MDPLYATEVVCGRLFLWLRGGWHGGPYEAASEQGFKRATMLDDFSAGGLYEERGGRDARRAPYYLGSGTSGVTEARVGGYGSNTGRSPATQTPTMRETASCRLFLSSHAVSGPFLYPFRQLFPDPSAGSFHFHFSYIAALVIYLLLHWTIKRVIRLVMMPHPSTVA
jgi:hypothetical protein